MIPVVFGVAVGSTLPLFRIGNAVKRFLVWECVESCLLLAALPFTELSQVAARVFHCSSLKWKESVTIKIIITKKLK